MAIDYSVALPCEPKRVLGDQGLIDRLRCLRKFHSGTPDEVRVAREAGFELRPLAFHCRDCPANHARREFGCTANVCLPVSEEAEQWLVDELPTTLNPEKLSGPAPRRRIAALRELVRRLRELGIDGSRVETRRGKGLEVEAERAAVRRYGVLTGRLRITSSQLLELLLFRDEIAPDLAEALCRALGAWEDHQRPSRDGVPEVIFTSLPTDQDDSSVVELKQLLLALMMACSLEVPVFTSRDPR